MTAALVSSQGFTYKMTRVTLSNCLISGVHLNSLLTSLSNSGLIFVFNKSARGVGCLAEGRRQRAAKWASPI
jgi:hypothetical protein